MAISGVTNTVLQPLNGRIQNGPHGNINQKYLRFDMTPSNGSGNNGSRQTVTFTFSNPVTNLSFTFTDIDNATGTGWGDRMVMIPTTGYVISIPPGGQVTGAGTDANRFRSNLTNANLGPTDNRGNLTLTFAGPVSSFAFTYRNETNTGGQNQQIGLSDLTFRC